MKASPHALPLEGLVKPFVSGFAAQQRSLDENFRLRCHDFEPIRKDLHGKGYSELAEAIAPSPVVTSEMTVEAAFHLHQDRESEFALGVRLLSLGYQRRFAYEEFADSSISVTIRRMPLAANEPPGSDSSLH